MSNDIIKKATGLLIIEVRNSNPNGDPDRESDPRQRSDERGEISPVSFKRKLRDLIEDKDGPVWKEISQKLSLKEDEFHILESRGRDRKEIELELKSLEGLYEKLKETRNHEDEAKRKKESAQIEEKVRNSPFIKKYWDGRIFGNTFLEKGSSTSIKTGVAQFGLGVSIAPIEIERMTNTSKAGVQEGKDRGMAPLAYRIVKHGVYCMPFFVNPTAAKKTNCDKKDIEVLLALIPYAYPHTASYIRPYVEIRHAWYVEDKSVLGSCSNFALIDALTPKKKEDPERPSSSWDDYDVPTKLPDALQNKVEPLMDLMSE
jgi:CRISPR-associated protein Csd2